MSGRRIGTIAVADSYCRRNTCVTSWSPRGALPCGLTTAPPCSLASASGNTRATFPVCTIVKPCRRSAVSSCSYACSRVTGRSVTSDSVPLTRGSTTKVRLVYWPMARTTASMSAFTKFSITGSVVEAWFVGFAAAWPAGAGAAAPGRWVRVAWAAAVGASEVTVIDSAQASAIERDRDHSPARLGLRLLVMSTTEIQEGSLSIAPAQQRNQARELRLHARVGARHGLCPACEAYPPARGDCATALQLEGPRNGQ